MFHQHYYFLLICLLGFISNIQAQELLSLEESLQIALDKNFNIRIAQEDTRIAENNLGLGNANFLPTVTVDGAYNVSRANTQQEFLDGRTQNVTGGNRTIRSAGINLNWTIFDGFTRFYTYRQLGAQKDFQEINLRLQMETTVANVMIVYNDIVQNVQTLDVLKKNLQVSRERLQVAKDRYELGAFSRIDFLRAQVDFNSDSALLINQNQAIVEAKIALNRLLNRSPEENFVVSDSIILKNNIDYLALKDQIQSQNKSLLIERKNLEIAQLDVEINRRDRLPTLDFTSRYSYSRSSANFGFVSSNRSFGLDYGIRLSYDLFNGFNQKRNLTNSRIEVRKSEEQLKNIRNEIAADFEVIYRDYLRNQELYQLESYNAEVAQQNLDIALDTYKLGGLSTIDFRDIQQQALDALNRLIAIQFLIKVAETEMLRISGELVKNQ